MREVTIHLDENGHVVDVHFDGVEQGTPIDAFVLLTSVPASPPASHILAYGNSDKVGRLLFSFWKNSCRVNPEGAWVLEQVAKDILEEAEQIRGNWPGEGYSNVTM